MPTNFDIATRQDFQIITGWIEPGSRVLDLGCNDGALLKHLQEQRQATGYGLELDTAYIPQCLQNNVNVIQMNLNDGLPDFDDQSFDYVILSLTLQSIKHPEQLLAEMLRVGKQAIVSFPNFGHWMIRTQLLFGGKMPVSKSLPYKWHNTPNIRLCTIKDFEEFCRLRSIKICESGVLNQAYESNFRLRRWPNLFSSVAMYRLAGQQQA